MTTETPNGIAARHRPSMAGLVLRGYRGPADLPGMFAANLAARRQAGIGEPVTLDGMVNQYAHLSNCDPATDILVVELAGKPVGYSRVLWADQHDGSREYEQICLLEPEVRGRGIGGAMLAWGEDRRRAIAAADPFPGVKRLGTNTWDPDVHATSLLRRNGYLVDRRGYEMERPTLDDIPDAPLPAGLLIRPVVPADWRPLFDAIAEAFRDHPGGQDDSEEEFQRFLADPENDPTTWLVAWDGDEIAGGVLGIIHPPVAGFSAEASPSLDPVFVRRPWRRRGLARALLVRCLVALRERGMTRCHLGVEASNPNQAMHLYESVGFVTRTSDAHWWRPIDAEEVEWRA